jgi:hypothetical protein
MLRRKWRLPEQEEENNIMKDTVASKFAYAAAAAFIAGMVVIFTMGLPEFEGQPPLAINLFTAFGLIFHWRCCL